MSLNVFGEAASTDTNGIATSTGDIHTSEQNSAIKEFKFEGVGLGATFTEVKTKYPDLKLEKDKSDPNVNLAVWVNYDLNTADAVDYYFFNGKVFKLEIIYLPKTLEKIGGYETIHERLVLKYGKEDQNLPNEKEICDYSWQFYDANRFLEYWAVSEGDDACLMIMDKKLARELSKMRKDKADVGF